MKQYTNRDWLFDAYINKELSIESISKICNVSLACIHQYLIKFDIPRRKFCGQPGIKCGKWKGGRTKSTQGYVWIHIDKPHLRQVSKNHKYVPEQILIVEKHLDRPLTKEEAIHHINEIKDDNRIENLYIFPNEHQHQRYHQKLHKGSGTPITESNIF